MRAAGSAVPAAHAVGAMRQRFETDAYLMQINDSRSARLSNATKLAARETEYDHWFYTFLVSTGRRLWALRQTSSAVEFSGQVGANLALNAHLAK